MKSKATIALTVLTIMSTASVAFGQIIPDNMRINWAPGVPGGIPDYPVEYDIVEDFGAVGDGVTDSTQAFVEALAATTPGHALYLPEGTFRVTDTLDITHGIAIRGAGPTRTVIHSAHENSTFTIFGEDPVQVTTLFAAAGKDAQTIQVASADGLATGDLVQLNRPDEVAQIVEIAEVSDTQLTITGVLYSDFPEGSTVARHDMVYGAGVEDMKIITDWPELDGYVNVAKVAMRYSAQSWVKNIEATGYSGREVWMIDVFQCEVRDSYFHQDLEAALAQDFFTIYGINMVEGCTDTLIENNLFNIYRHAMVIQLNNAGGNVFGYNMSWDCYTQNQTDAEAGTRREIIGDIDFHHQQVETTLFEGNHAEYVRFNDGSEEYRKLNNVLLRNRITQSGINANEHVNYIIGNELPQRKYESSDGSWIPSNDIRSGAGPVLHGNYVVYDGEGLTWNPSIEDREIPVSYYLSERPGWFCDLAWPAFGGDLMPDNKRRSPAEVRFWSMQFPEESPSDLTLNAEADGV
ncbi:MAG: hypothetical protein GY854_31895, partial [Deltaproteobacteria bacterium]|nr:hypothetical protein [Deltaproteobacteria bacterium]